MRYTSADTMRDALGRRAGDKQRRWSGSLAPPIFSHSSAFTLCPHPRNVPDDVLRLLRKREDIVIVTFSLNFISY